MQTRNGRVDQWARGALASALLVAAPACATSRWAAPNEDAALRRGDETQRNAALDPYGDWVTTNRYGGVWRPHGMAAGWRPYSMGWWSYRRPGWTWISAHPWGWVPFHYGRWVYDPTYGWVWIPGTVWGPAWVTWSYANTYIGWAPLPPWGLARPLAPRWWCYADRRAFWRRRFKPRIYAPGRNPRLRRLASPPRRTGPLPVRRRSLVNARSFTTGAERTTTRTRADQPRRRGTRRTRGTYQGAPPSKTVAPRRRGRTDRPRQGRRRRTGQEGRRYRK